MADFKDIDFSKFSEVFKDIKMQRIPTPQPLLNPREFIPDPKNTTVGRLGELIELNKDLVEYNKELLEGIKSLKTDLATEREAKEKAEKKAKGFEIATLVISIVGIPVAILLAIFF